MRITNISQNEQVSLPKSKINHTSRVCGSPLRHASKTSTNAYLHRIPSFEPHIKSIVFKGAKIYILDGGIHGKNMKYFAKSLKSDIEVLMHDVHINPKDRYTKQLESLLDQLKTLNKKAFFNSNEYIAIPCLSSVPLLNLQDQYNRVIGEKKRFTPENIKSHKENILKFLKKIYEQPNQYREYIDYMDEIHCGIEYSYGVIQEINKLVEKKCNIYIPSGHPADLSLKWLANQRGLKPELYHYIATGEDKNSVIRGLQDEIKQKNWYSFNLLALSDAHVVGLKDTDWTTDYIYSGYDSCITESARGVYNLTPIREDKKVIGYSFHDETVNNYPYSEFPMNNEVLNLLEFVGRNKEEVLASEEETKNFINLTSYQRTLYPYNKKLYKIEDVFSQAYINNNKINLLGKYTDYTLKVFYDENSDGKIIFKKTDCEGSGRPSVLTMWGSCFALFNAISNNIDARKKYSNGNNLAFLMKCANFAKKNGERERYIKTLISAAEAEKTMDPEANSPESILVYEELADIYQEQKEYKKASGCLNRAIYILANQFLVRFKGEDLIELKRFHTIYQNSYNDTMNYLSEQKNYINASFLEKIFMSKPIKPSNYEEYKKYIKENEKYLYYNTKFVSLYRKLANICQLQNESYPSKICNLAAIDIEEGTPRGLEIIHRRKDGNFYIGDLYDAD